MRDGMISSQRTSSSTLLSAGQDSDTASIRPRNRRHLSARDAETTTSSGRSTPAGARSPNRDDGSSLPAAHIGGVTGRNDSRGEVARSPARSSRAKSPGGGGIGGGLLEGSWAPSWASVQELASSLLTGAGSHSEHGRPGSRDSRGSKQPKKQTSGFLEGLLGNDSSSSWGPEPPRNESRPRMEDVAAGTMTKREAALKAMRTASVLESHDGVNGGLDVTRRNYKRRNSDEDLSNSSTIAGANDDQGEHLVYIHHVQPNDTYAGIVLKYRCREDAFRRANGLWSRDNVQVRKWLAIPVDACEVKGRPCEGPSGPGGQVDLLARTPEVTDPFGGRDRGGDGFFHSASNGQSPYPPSDQQQQKPGNGEEDRPWTHVRWVSLDSSPNPVEIARVPRKALGYFPPRRKKSVHTASPILSPSRGSVDVPSIALESPRSSSSRRPSILSNSARTPLAGGGFSGRSRGDSVSGMTDEGSGGGPKPAWMRRPGGVGSLGKSVRAPGPEKDYFNTWTNKHIPGLNIDKLPSMSVMGAEMARFGFSGSADERSAIVESPFEDGRDALSSVAGGSGVGGNQGTGLDKAAAAVETWLRGAFTKRPLHSAGTPVLGSSSSSMSRGGRTPGAESVGDLIELTDTNSDDGRGNSGGPWGGDSGGLLDSGFGLISVGGGSTSSGRRGDGSIRGRIVSSGGDGGKDKKAD